MKLFMFCLLTVAAAFVDCKPFGNVNDAGAENIWAVLIAGTNTWKNYRHQSDVSHAYHVLINHGIPAEQIIVFMYDDIANNPLNPYPGKIFNQPNGPDVYEGVIIDYSGEDVNKYTIMNALKGDAESNIGNGTGRVLQSNSTDNVFIFHSGHGAANLLQMPNERNNLMKKEFNETLYSMYENKMYDKLLFYLEACEAGSMFEGLPSELNIFAVTASNASQSSYGRFCGDPKMSPNCFADEFSFNWMNNTEFHNILHENVGIQVDNVAALTTGSNVSQYGYLDLRNDTVADFQGKEASNSSQDYMECSWDESQDLKIMSRDVALFMIESQMRRQKASAEVIEATMKKYYQKREEMEEFFKKASKVLSSKKSMETMPPKTAVEELDCHEEAIKVFDKLCAPFHENPYALKFSANIANLCKIVPDSKPIVAYFETHCKNGPRFFDVL